MNNPDYQYVDVRILSFYQKPRILETAFLVELYNERAEAGELPKAVDEDGKRRSFTVGDVVLDDYVSYCPPAMANNAVVNQNVRRVMRAANVKPDNQAPEQAKASWELADMVKNAYEHWKKGTEMPEFGTPLAVCSFIPKGVLDAFGKAGIRTIEELAALNEQAMKASGIMNVRELKQQATRWLKAADSNKFATELKERDDEIAKMQATMKEQAAALAELKMASETSKVDELKEKLKKTG